MEDRFVEENVRHRLILSGIAELEELGVKKIEYAVFTHPHADHIGAADLVLTTFEV